MLPRLQHLLLKSKSKSQLAPGLAEVWRKTCDDLLAGPATEVFSVGWNGHFANKDTKVENLILSLAWISLAATLSACAPSMSARVDGDAGANLVTPTEAPDIVVVGRRRPEPSVQVTAADLQRNMLPIPAWANKPQSETWTRMTLHALKDLGKEMIQTELKDGQEFCPAYSHLGEADRQKVWVQLISSMAKFESGFNPLAAYVESFFGRDHKHVVSRGLLQISRSSANLYGCNIVRDSQLSDPETNLRCGVRILNTLVSKYKAVHGLQDVQAGSDLSNPWRGAARYWSVLRGKAKDLFIRASVRQLTICRV